MLSPVYVFGPHATVGCAEALMSALQDHWPTATFEVTSEPNLRTAAKQDVINVATTPAKRLPMRVYEHMVTFARGFVAGYQAPATQVAVGPTRYATLPSTPEAKRKSEPPTSGPIRYPTLFGIAPPSTRGGKATV